jgi:hypothetical protein
MASMTRCGASGSSAGAREQVDDFQQCAQRVLGDSRHRHRFGLVAVPLVVNAALSFVVEPLGDTSPVAKYGANSALVITVLAMLGWARHRLRHT